MRTTGISISRERRRARRGRPARIRFRASSDLVVLTRDVPGLGRLIDAAADTGVDVFGPDFQLQRPDPGQHPRHPIRPRRRPPPRRRRRSPARPAHHRSPVNRPGAGARRGASASTRTRAPAAASNEARPASCPARGVRCRRPSRLHRRTRDLKHLGPPTRGRARRRLLGSAPRPSPRAATGRTPAPAATSLFSRSNRLTAATKRARCSPASVAADFATAAARFDGLGDAAASPGRRLPRALRTSFRTPRDRVPRRCVGCSRRQRMYSVADSLPAARRLHSRRAARASAFTSRRGRQELRAVPAKAYAGARRRLDALAAWTRTAVPARFSSSTASPQSPMRAPRLGQPGMPEQITQDRYLGAPGDGPRRRWVGRGAGRGVAPHLAQAGLLGERSRQRLVVLPKMTRTAGGPSRCRSSPRRKRSRLCSPVAASGCGTGRHCSRAAEPTGRGQVRPQAWSRERRAEPSQRVHTSTAWLHTRSSAARLPWKPAWRSIVASSSRQSSWRSTIHETCGREVPLSGTRRKRPTPVMASNHSSKSCSSSRWFRIIWHPRATSRRSARGSGGGSRPQGTRRAYCTVEFADRNGKVHDATATTGLGGKSPANPYFFYAP